MPLKTEIINGRILANIDDLRPWEDNPRQITEEKFELLMEKIKKVEEIDPSTDGQFKPLVVTTLGVVVGGNMRLRAYEKLGKKKLWVSVVDTDNPRQAFEIAILDNMRFGTYVEEDLAELAAKYELTETEMEGLDFDLGESTSLKDILSELQPDPEVEEDKQPEKEEVALSKKGKIYLLGRHRLMCGDSTNPDDVARLMDGEKADMVFTDPPYNVNYSGQGKKTKRTILNDKMSSPEFFNFLADTFHAMDTVLKENGPVYVCFSQTTHIEFETALKENDFRVKSEIIWVKPNATLGWQEYRHKYEPIFYAYRTKEQPQFYGDRRNTTHWEFEPSDEQLLEWAREQYVNADQQSDTDVWPIERDSAGDYEHPTQKPVKLPARAIENHSRPGEIVLDLFLGGGATLIAAEQLERSCYGMELDPTFVDVIRKRYAKFIGREEDWEAATPEVK